MASVRIAVNWRGRGVLAGTNFANILVISRLNRTPSQRSVCDVQCRVLFFHGCVDGNWIAAFAGDCKGSPRLVLSAGSAQSITGCHNTATPEATVTLSPGL